eukprot:364224-Chlamydomonas_euryale.AAC.4
MGSGLRVLSGGGGLNTPLCTGPTGRGGRLLPHNMHIPVPTAARLLTPPPPRRRAFFRPVAEPRRYDATRVHVPTAAVARVRTRQFSAPRPCPRCPFPPGAAPSPTRSSPWAPNLPGVPRQHDSSPHIIAPLRAASARRAAAAADVQRERAPAGATELVRARRSRSRRPGRRSHSRFTASASDRRAATALPTGQQLYPRGDAA